MFLYLQMNVFNIYENYLYHFWLRPLPTYLMLAITTVAY